MGVPLPGMDAAEPASAEALLAAFGSMDAAERSRHEAVLDYWLSIRGGRDFPAIHDLDPLELSEAAPCSLLLELAGGGQDAEVRHIGEALKAFGEWPTVGEAPRPSLIACVASKLGIVAISRSFLAFEDEFPAPDGPMRCAITLLPFSSTGAWVDFVYGFVTLQDAAEAAAEADPDLAAIAVENEPEAPPIASEEAVEELPEETPEPAAEPQAEAAPASVAVPGFSKLLAPLKGFHGTHARVEPTLPPVPDLPEPADDELAPDEPAAAEIEPEEAIAEPPEAMEGSLQSRLEDVRAKADEARQARLRSEQALHEGLSAAYDFALDAEDSPEDYLRLVEAQGLKIQLRAPMAPVVKLGFAGLADESTIARMESVLAWALKEELPRGGLGERIEQAGGLEPLLGEIGAA